MNEDYVVEGFIVPPHPKGIVLSGKTVRLEPLNVKKHSEDFVSIKLFRTSKHLIGGIYRMDLLKR